MRTLTLTNLEQYPRIYAALTGEIPNQIPTGDSRKHTLYVEVVCIAW